MPFSLLAVVGLLAIAAPASALTITDGNFTTWSFSAAIHPAEPAGPGSATVTREVSGGNPDARLNVTTVTGATHYGTAIKTDFSSTESLDGRAFTMTLDVVMGPGAFGQGQGILALVEQAGSVYGYGGPSWPAGPNWITFLQDDWTTLKFAGVFDADQFLRMFGSGPTHPDFGGGTATQFGFAAGNSNSGTLTQYYDNFSMENTRASVPEPGTIVLVVSAMTVHAVALARPRRGRSSRHSSPDLEVNHRAGYAVVDTTPHQGSGGTRVASPMLIR